MISRYFHLVLKSDVPRAEPWECDRIPGLRALYSISSTSGVDSTKLMVRYLSCFCGSCQAQCWKECDNLHHVHAWRLVRIKPHKMRHIRRQIGIFMENQGDSSQVNLDQDELTDDLRIGDTFSVVAEPGNDKGVRYYILECQSEKIVVQRAFTCVWGNRFEVGDHAIEGIYHQKWRRGAHNYVFLDDSDPAYVHSHLVKCTKFDLVPSDHKVRGSDPVKRLLPNHHKIIMKILG
jgi:hypothetical protein